MSDEHSPTFSGFFAKLLLGLLVGSFILWGVADVFKPGQNSATVATVNGDRISVSAFGEALRERRAMYQQMLGKDVSIELLQSLGLTQQVLHMLINETLILQNAERYGVVVGDNSIANKIRSLAEFKDEQNKFDKEKFQRALQGAGLTEAAFVAGLRKEITSKLLTDSIKGDLLLPDPLHDALYRVREERREAKLYIVGKETIRDVAPPDEASLTEYYQAHQEMFGTEELRSFNLVELRLEAVIKQTQVKEEELKEIYETRKNTSYSIPEKREIQQLLYPDKTAADAAYALLEAKKAFKDVAAQTKATNLDNLSLGLLSRTELPQAAQDVVFALKKDEFSTPVQSDFGWHIYYVTSVAAARVMPFAEVQESLKKEITQERAEEALYQLSISIEDMIANGSSLEEIAAAAGVSTRAFGPITKGKKNDKGALLDSLPLLPEELDTAFAQDKGTLSMLQRSKSGFYYLVQVENIIPAHVKPLKDIKEQVSKAWKEEQRQAKLLTQAEKLSGILNSPTNAAQTAVLNLVPLGSGAITRGATATPADAPAANIELPAGLTEELFQLDKGHATAPYLLSKGDYMIAKLAVISPALTPDAQHKDAQEAYKNLQAELQEHYRNELLMQYVAYLQHRSSIDVNEAVLSRFSEVR